MAAWEGGAAAECGAALEGSIKQLGNLGIG